jgi:hypothetical protein
MRAAVLALMFLGLTTAIGADKPKEAPAKKQKADTNKEAGKMQTYLGLAIEALPPFLASQLPETVPSGQGVLVVNVAKDSPAAKAGLKPHDILLSFGDQKVYSPEQLVKLVRGDKPGQEVAVAYVRRGKRESCKVKLGQHEQTREEEQPRVFRLRPDDTFSETFEEHESKDGWESFESLKLTKLGRERWRAEIEYRSKEGKKEHKTFEGTRPEIRRDIHADKDMTAHEKHHLLRAMNIHGPIFEFHLPRFGRMMEGFGEQP